MKRLLFFFAYLFLCNVLFAQNSIKFNNAYLPNSLATDVIPCSGGYMVFGSVNDSVSPYNFRVYVMKIDTTGNKLWVKSYGKRGYNYDVFFPWGGGHRLLSPVVVI